MMDTRQKVPHYRVMMRWWTGEPRSNPIEHYVRFGRIPKSGRSAISSDYRQMVEFRTGQRLPSRESGLSVYEARWDGRRKQWMIPSRMWESYMGGLSQNIEDACSGERAVLLVTGLVVGEGSDGEPILANVNVVKTLDVRDVWNDEVMRDLGWSYRGRKVRGKEGADWECKPRGHSARHNPAGR